MAEINVATTVASPDTMRRVGLRAEPEPPPTSAAFALKEAIGIEQMGIIPLLQARYRRDERQRLWIRSQAGLCMKSGIGSCGCCLCATDTFQTPKGSVRSLTR